MSDLSARLRGLATGRCAWVDTRTGAVEADVLPWRDRWALFGVHSHTWRWVRRFGTKDCGCTDNPVTRRRVLISFDCPEHGRPKWRRDSFDEDWYADEEWEDEWT